jgi:hypothetical protein
LILFCFNHTGFEPRIFVLAGQALYCLSHASSPFGVVILEIRPCFLSRAAWTTILPFSAVPRMTNVCYHTYLFFCGDGGLANIFA